jgi:hypothetical protein
MKRTIRMLLSLCFINSVCFSQHTGTSPVQVAIGLDTTYSYPYKGLWFHKPVALEDMFSNEKAYKIKVTLKNSGERTIYLHMMTCSKIDQLQIDNELIEFLFWGCDGNFLTQYELKKGEAETFYVELIRRSDYYTNTGLAFKPFHGRTRIGFVLINDIYDDRFLWDDKRRGIVWSNILNLSLR